MHSNCRTFSFLRIAKLTYVVAEKRPESQNCSIMYLQINWPSELVYTILHSRKGHLNVVRYLLTEAHCDPNVKNDIGWTHLHYACQ